MTIRHMKIFCAVCDCGSNATKAAEQLHMTQPAVSLAIKELEDYYGTALFDRLGRRLVLSEAGKEFLKYARHIASLFDDMEKGMRDWDTLGVLRVGASITIGSQFLPSYVKAFYARYPGTSIKARVASSEQLEAMVLKNELDFALIEGVVHDVSLEREAYQNDRLAVICAADAPFEHGQTLSIEEFRQQKFLLREKSSGTREEFDRAVQQAGFAVTPEWEAQSTTALVNAVVHGLGIAVLPHRMIKGPIERGIVKVLRVEGIDFTRNFHIIYHKNKLLTSSARAFLDICRNYEADYPMPNYNGLY